MKPRYSIIRVDGLCPLKLERKLNCDNRLCKDCKIIQNYGDTKEQLINKITTALRRTWLNEDNQSFREVAEEIVEFLGVKE